MNSSDEPPEEGPRKPRSPFGYPDFGSSQWQDHAAQIRLSGERPPAQLPRLPGGEDPREFLSRRRAEIAEEARQQELHAAQHRRLLRSVAEPDKPAAPAKRQSGRAVPAEPKSGVQRGRPIGTAPEDAADKVPLAEPPAPARREPPAPGRVSRRGVIGAPPS